MKIAPEITTLSSVAALLDSTLRDLGHDPVPLFEQAGIEPSSVGNPNVRIPTVRMQALWRLALDKSGDPALGLTAAQHFLPAALHGLGLACLASDTLRDVLGRLVRFSHLINILPDFALEEDTHTVDLRVTLPDLGRDFVHAPIDLAMAVFLRMCQITASDDILPVRTSLQRPLPADTRPYEIMFGKHIEFDTACSVLSFDRSRALTPLFTAHPELARQNDQTVIDYLARFDRDNITLRVRTEIIEQLPGGRPSQSGIAEKLHTSQRSLQRRLHDQDTSYKELLNDIQRELALDYIRDSDRSIGEITYLLGFSEPCNFNRAFKRWTGKSPGEYRDDH